MNILDQENVLDEQIKLLNTPGPTLSNFYTFDEQHQLFFEPQPTIKQSIEKTYKFTNIKTTANYPNSAFNILTYVILSTILEENTQRGLLERLKCTLYSPSINLTRIIGFENKSLKSNNAMKKIIVQFLQILKYHTGDLQNLLNHYPIIVQIFTLMFRTILSSFHFKDAQFYNKQLNSFNTLTSLLDFFDVVYQIRNNIIVFQNKGTCVFIDEQTNRYYIGERMTDLSTKNSDLHLDFGEPDDDEEEQGVLFKKEYCFFNAPTPCFGEASWDELKHSIKNSHKEEFHDHPALEKVEQDLQQSPSAMKLSQQPELIYYDIDQKDITKKMKSIFESIPNSPTNDNQVSKNQTYQKLVTQAKKTKIANTVAKNPQKMKCSQIQQYLQSQEYEKKSSKSQNIGKRKTQQNEVGIEDKNDGKLSQYAPETKLNKLQSCVVQVKIEPDEKRPRTNAGNTFDQTKSAKRFEPKNTTGYQVKNMNKTFKIPEFLVQRRTSTSPINSVNTTARKNEQKIKRPRVTFTYSSNNIKKNLTYTNPYIPVDTSRINYVSETINTGSSVKYQNSPPINKPPFLYSPNQSTRPSQWQYFGA